MRDYRTVVVAMVLGASLALTSGLSAQTDRQNARRADPMTASIKGIVTAADTGGALRGAEVRLSSRGSYSRLVTTDHDGSFTLSDLPAGEYRLTVSRVGFTPLVFGQRRPLEAPKTIALSEGQTFTANLALTRGGVIHGHVLDAFGEPIAGTRVQVLRSRMVRGQRRLQSMGPGDQTDDTGGFRIYGLPPGDYYVTASAGPADSVKRDPPIYYPGTPSYAEAQTISVPAGAEASADFQLVPLRSARVSGVVFDASGAPVQAMVQLASEAVGMGPVLENAGPPPAFTINADAGPNGTFTIDNVPPGPYQLTANSSFTAGVLAGIAAADGAAGRNRAMEEIMARGPETASMALIVSGDDVSGLALTTRRGGVLKGAFVAAPGVVQPLPQGLQVSVRSLGAGGASMMQGGARGEFQLAGMSGPFYLEVQGIPDGWAISQVTVDGEDVTDEPIDVRGGTAAARIVMTDRLTTISGTVQSRNGVSSHSVVVFPDDEARWAYPSRYVRAVRADDRGRFRIPGLPPNARYFVAAVDYLEEGDEQDPQFLERLRARAMTILLGEGEQRSVVLDPVTQ
jgi:hypothetical protein